MSTRHEPPLRIRLVGPATTGGRIRFREFSAFVDALQRGLDRTALLLLGRPTGKGTMDGASLELVGMEAGSVAFLVDRAPSQKPLFEDLDVGELALERFFEGLDRLQAEQPGLPEGYDMGVLRCWKEVGRVFARGVERVEFTLRTGRINRTFRLDAESVSRITQRILKPVPNMAVVEGRLLMGDFKEGGTRCRLHPFHGRPISCEFDETLADAVHALLRRHVRIAGEGEYDLDTSELKRLRIRDIEPLDLESEAPAPSQLAAMPDFWVEKSLDELAEEQGVTSIDSLDAVLGQGRELWDSDEDFEEFVRGIYERRETAYLRRGRLGRCHGRCIRVPPGNP